MYLVDTNVWLERLLDPALSAQVGQFLTQIPPDDLLMTDFTFHSIGVILDRLAKHDVLPQFADDLVVHGRVTLVSVQPEAMHYLIVVMDQFNLDFDDAYQYVAAEQSDAIVVSFDGDFDRTDRGRQKPEQVLASQSNQGS